MPLAAGMRDRIAVLAALAGVIALSWWYLVRTARDMYGAMDGPAAWMMTGAWDASYFALMCGMWSAMMAGMMLPSAAPTVLLYAAVLRNGDARAATLGRSSAFAAGYLLAWTGFSAAVTALQWALVRAALLSPMMESTRPLFDACVLIAAGIYQWTPLKRSCLRLCRAPVDFISRHWRNGPDGALLMGLHHGLYCVGCCWVLMLLLFVGGVMNLAWIAAISAVVLLEKLMPLGDRGGRAGGVLLIALGLGVLLKY